MGNDQNVVPLVLLTLRIKSKIVLEPLLHPPRALQSHRPRCCEITQPLTNTLRVSLLLVVAYTMVGVPGNSLRNK